MRLRTHFNIWAPLALIAIYLALDPDSGLGIKVFSPTTVGMILMYSKGLIMISAAFWTAKILLDYKAADTEELFKLVAAGNLAAAVAILARFVLLGILIWAFGKAGDAHALDARTYIPEQAKIYVPLLKIEQQRFWPDHPQPELLAALGEQESCIHLKHPRCYNPASKLDTSREFSGGIGQLAKAYTAAGALRFDALAELRAKHSELSGLTWNNLFQMPSLQLRALVLKMRDDYQHFGMVAGASERLAMADGAYNSGQGRIDHRRRVCGLKHGCNPQVWFGHVELINVTGAKALYGNRTAYMITNEHVEMVVRVRSPKYRWMMA